METLDRFRTALKFSLWAWALYWPGGGLLLLLGGLDPVSIAVTFLSLGSFVLLLSAGALRTTSSRTAWDFVLERPIYLIAAFVLLLVVGQAVDPLQDIGLGVFATALLAGIVLCAVRLLAHVRQEHGGSVLRAGADQALLLFALAGFGAFCVSYDAVADALVGDTLGFSAATVAMMNWLNLLYPPLVLLATRGLREPLRLPWRRAPRPLPAATAKA